jgi:AraC family transcriptional regulator
MPRSAKRRFARKKHAMALAEMIRPATIEALHSIMPSPPIATSRGKSWGGVTIELYGAQPRVDMTRPALDHHLVLCVQSGCGRLLQRRGGQVCDSLISLGMTIIVPAGCESFWLGDIPKCVSLAIPKDLLGSVATRIHDCAADTAADLRNVFGTHDWLIDQLSAILLSEIDKPSHPSQCFIVDSASSALVAHLLRTYGSCGTPKAKTSSTLGARALKKVLQYIEENLDAPIAPATLAEISGLSRFHFARLFKSSTGLSPMAYLDRTRIKRAQDLIRQGDMSLAEIALSVGYADQSHFTRRFNRQVGTTPAAFGRSH